MNDAVCVECIDFALYGQVFFCPCLRVIEIKCWTEGLEPIQCFLLILLGSFEGDGVFDYSVTVD